MARVTDWVLPPGFRFSPTDEELIIYYLFIKVIGGQPPTDEVVEYNLYADHEIWRNVLEESKVKTVYFFAKLEKGQEGRPKINRSTGCGTWRAQDDEPILFKQKQIGSKRTFVFTPQTGLNANRKWIMDEYRLGGVLQRYQNYYVVCRVKLETEEDHFSSPRTSMESEETETSSASDNNEHTFLGHLMN